MGTPNSQVQVPPRGRSASVVAPKARLTAYRANDPRWQETYKVMREDGSVAWESHPGPQSFALACQCDFILYGGARGGGKSACGTAWLATGDWSLPLDHPCRYSYLREPGYKALVLRENYQDLRDWIEEAKPLYATYGGKFADDPAVCTFPSGAKIFTNHLGNPEAYSKYKSWNITRILIEELTLIPEKKLFLKVLGSNRANAKLGHLRSQVFCTTNPDGPGSSWVKEFFVDVYDNHGQKVAWGTPMIDPVTKLSRIFIPAKLDDNPSLNHNERYRGILMSQDPDTRRAWLDGDWDACTGPFFKEWRPRGPHPHEEKLYPWAQHVLPASEIKPIPYWYHRWGSGDWGFNHQSSFHKYVQNEQDGRVHVYDELTFQGVGAFDIGVRLAKWYQQDLESLPDNKITLYLSPDAFAKRDDTNTLAEQIQSGIWKYFGPYSSFIMQFNEEEKQVAIHDRGRAERMFADRQTMFSGKMAILLKPANNDRVGGWNFIREMLRYIPVLPDVKPDLEYAKSLYEKGGHVPYVEYLAQFKDMKPEVLPKLVVYPSCPDLIKCMGILVHDEKRKEDVLKVDGDDSGDSLRYGLKAYQDHEASTQPKFSYVGEKLAAAAEKHTDYNILIQVSRNAQAQWDANNDQHLQAWTPPRQGSMRWRT